MQALVYVAPHTVRVMDWDEPQPRPDQAVVQVQVTGICGSDMAGFLGKSSRRVPPLILGHEVVGIVQSAPTDSGVETGDRVVVNPFETCGACAACIEGKENRCTDWRLLGMDEEQGGFAERVAVDARNLTVIGPDLPVEVAAMTEPLANTVHVLGIAEAEPVRTMLIIGAGTQGSLATVLARRAGIERIAVSETDPARLALAGELGADLCLNPRVADVADEVWQWSHGGVDLVLDAVGTSKARATAAASARKGGRVILLGLHDQASDLDFASVVRNEITLIGSFSYTRRDFAEALRLLQSGEVDPSPYVRTMPLARGQEAFEVIERGPGTVLKILLVP